MKLYKKYNKIKINELIIASTQDGSTCNAL